MSDNAPDGDAPVETVESLRQQTMRLESELEAVRADARQKVMQADLKVAAIRAGMIDLDGIKLLDMASVGVTEDGRVSDAIGLMKGLKNTKPWLFGQATTSSPVSAPPSSPPRQKMALEMSDAEYQAARALILKHRS